ncbi:MAG: TonB-dependent receptor [Calditrichaeota bacterium]|nr:TonB-dependent receptor [Calditrichota bacterium]
MSRTANWGWRFQGPRHHRAALTWAMALAAVIRSAWCLAQQPRPDTVAYRMPAVVVTASRHEQDPLLTSVPVTLLERRAIVQALPATVGEALVLAPGVAVTSSGPWSQQPVIRGLKGAQVLTLINGQRLDVLRSYGQHAPLLDVGQVERVEVVRGPHSVQYGSDAVGGVVNYVTTPAFVAAQRPAVTTRGFVQSSSADEQRAAGLSLLLRGARANARLRLGGRRAENVRTPRGRLPNSQYRGIDADIDFAYQPSPAHLVRCGVSSVRSSNVGVPTSPYAERARFRLYERTVLSLAYEHQPRSGAPRIEVNAHYQWGKRNFEALLHVPRGVQRLDQVLEAHRSADSFGATLLASGLVWGHHLFTSGVDLFGEDDNTRRTAISRLYDGKGALVKETVDRIPPTPPARRWGVGIFACDEHSPVPWASVSAGLRVDHLQSSATGTRGTLAEADLVRREQNVSGNLGASVAVTDGVRLFANLGRAFKGPSLQERFFKGVGQLGFVVGNPELHPETSLNLDAGVKWRTERCRGELSVFRNRVNDLIVLSRVTVAPDTFKYANVGRALLQGGEFEVEARLLGPLRAQAQASYVRGTDEASGQPLPQIPPLNGRICLYLQAPAGRWWGRLTARLVGDQRRVAANELATPGYVLCDVGAGLPLQSGATPVELAINITNLFDRSYRDHLSTVTWWDAPGRNVVVSMSWGARN